MDSSWKGIEMNKKPFIDRWVLLGFVSGLVVYGVFLYFVR